MDLHPADGGRGRLAPRAGGTIALSASTELTLHSPALAWHWAWPDGRLRSQSFDNCLSDRTFALADAQELAVVLSAEADRLAEPLRRVADFRVVSVDSDSGSGQGAVVHLRSDSAPIAARVHLQLEGPTRRKWVELTHDGPSDLLLLDVELDAFAIDAALEGGGPGQPLLIGAQAFAAVEHPAGWNEAEAGRVRLGHHPGLRLAAGQTLRSCVALLSVAAPGCALSHFTDYIQQRCRRRQGLVSVYTPFGINNQWGACPTLDDEQTLDVLRVLARWQKRGLRFDYFTLDSGWVDPDSDLTRFRPNAYPDGPGAIAARVDALGMKLGLWFATSWGTQSCWDHPPAFADGEPPGLLYREGYPLTLGGLTFCLGWEPYYRILRDAVLHHVRHNGVRFLKFDGGMYQCDNPDHGHLPGRWATERMYARLIDIAESARALAPDLFVMWYWGLRSPFWALHGDTIFESGLHMEGSGTSAVPTLHYRDSVTLAQDQNVRHARALPPLVKDSLGVWLADNRWGNFMGRERWREAMVMDLGRANLLFPNLWGNVYHLDDDDVAFLARLTRLARRRQALLLRRRDLGDPWRNEVYGHACCAGRRGLLFLHNAHFEARSIRLRLDGDLGLRARPGTALQLAAHFPERERLVAEDGQPHRCGDAVEPWLRPFEVLLLEIAPPARAAARLPVRALTRAQAEALGRHLPLAPARLERHLDVTFADAERFEGQGHRKQSQAFGAVLPPLAGPQPMLAVVVRLRQGEAEWRYSPAVVEIVQAVVRVGPGRGQAVQLVPVPDSRQYGNTQKAGCSWVVFKARLSREGSQQPLALAVHAWLPEGVAAHVEAWIVHRWWRQDARPAADGYYTCAPS